MNKNNTTKESESRKSSGLVHLMTALHSNATSIVTSKTLLNGPDQLLDADSYITNRRNGSVKLRKETIGLGSEEPVSIPTMLRDIAETYPDVIAFRVKRSEEWTTWNYEQYYQDVKHAALGFIQLGLHRHHSVAILGNNAPEWIISALGAIFAGGIAVGLYTSFSPEDIARVAIDSKADIIIVQNEVFLKKVLLIQHKLPDLKALVQYNGEPPLSDKRRLHRTHKKHIISWSQLLEIGQSLPEEKLEDRLARIAINQCAALVYSSGTVHPSRGVMYSHDNLTWSSKMSASVIRAPGFNRNPQPGEEILFSFLPFSGLLGLTIDIFYTLLVVGTLVMVNDANVEDFSDSFFNCLLEITPTVFFASPNIYEKLYHRLRLSKEYLWGFQRLFLDWSADTLREKYTLEGFRGRKSNHWSSSLAKNAISNKIKKTLGFCSRTVFFSRGGPMTEQLLQFLMGYDILVHESFGQNENCGLLASNIPKRYCQLGTNGKPVPGVRVKISPVETPTPYVNDNTGEIGEISIWGRNIFMGYLNKENESKSVIEECSQYCNLGDLGYLDSCGFLVVLGSSEDFVTLKSGEIISSLHIEQLIRLELPCVYQAVIVGDNQESLTALLSLDIQDNNILGDETRKWFRRSRYDVVTIQDVMEQLGMGLSHVIQAGIDRANQRVSTASQMIVDWRIVKSPFSYESGEVGLNGKLKRATILENHGNCIKGMYRRREGDGNLTSDMETLCNNVDNNLIPHSLTQIKEEDETKCSSVNSMTEHLQSFEESSIKINLESSAYTAESSDETSGDSSRKTSASSESSVISSFIPSVLTEINHEKITRK